MGRSEKRLLRRRGSRSVLFLAAALATSVVACAGVLGLDEFDKGECPGARCGDGAPPPDVIVPDGQILPDAGDGGFEGSTGTDPTTWAKWPMPNYNLPDGAAGPGVPLLYRMAGPEDVADEKTGLTWKTKAFPEAVTQTDARSRCAQIVDPGGVKWRLPKRIELITLLDYGQTSPAPYIRRGTPGFASDFGTPTVWTSSDVMEVGTPVTAVKPTGKYWGVNFSSGKLVQINGLDKLANALCVKGL